MISFDAASSGTALPATAPLNISHTCTGSNRLLLVGIQCQSDAITGVTYNAVAMTQTVKIAAAGGGSEVYLYSLIAPSTGTNTIAISYAGSLFVRAVAASYAGVLQTGYPDASNSTNNTGNIASLALSITIVGSNAWMSTFTYGNTTTASAGTGGTSRGTADGKTIILDSNAPLSAGSNSITANFSPNSTTESAAVGASFLPAVTGSGNFLSVL